MDQLRAAWEKFKAERDRAFHEATEFKPGDLTAEEEEFVRQEGLTALSYVPQKTIQKQAEAFEKYEIEMRRRRRCLLDRRHTRSACAWKRRRTPDSFKAV